MAMEKKTSAVASSSASSSSVTSPKKYDVFLSFRGEDTRRKFTSHLYDALCRKKVRTFMDNVLGKGDEISPALIRAIEESHASIVIFSENYASSTWCLDELVKIQECRQVQGQIVIPVFYEIDPSDVRKQSGSYKEAFAAYEERGNIDKLKKWRKALTEAASLAGFDSRSYGDDCELIKSIVRVVLQKLNSRYPQQLTGPVGTGISYGEIESSLKIGSREVRIIGIWGMGGIGKTTLATALYTKLSSQFEGHCFLSNVREESNKYGLHVLRKNLFSKLLEEENLHLDVTNPKSHFVACLLKRKKVFIVLDDVTSSEQLHDLISNYNCCDYDCLGPGSRVIVTTRDKSIFRKVHGIYEVKGLSEHDSLHLFCLNAFGEKHPKNGYEDLSHSAIAYCKGNPLALKVLGAILGSKRTIRAWEHGLRKLREIQDVKIHDVLRLSYDDLDRIEKNIFLDIACFFKGKSIDHVKSLLEACDFFPESGIEDLCNKALITISDDKIGMHDLIQEMGLEIVNRECINDPGRRSRLWKPKDVFDVLKNDTGTRAVEGITFDISKASDLHLSSYSLERMTCLRYLEVYGISDKCNIYFPDGLGSLSDKLRYLHWPGFCLESLPSTFCAEKLVEIHMPSSKLKMLWNGVQNLVNLKKINLGFSKHLIEVPDLSRATNLETVDLRSCESLNQLCPSVLSLPKLTHLNLQRCREIKSFKSNVHSKSVCELQLDGCSSLVEFSVTSEEMRKLSLQGTAICELPSSIWLNRKLAYLYLSHCNNLNIVGNRSSDDPGIEYLRELDLSGCTQINALNLHLIFDGIRCLKRLDLSCCYHLKKIPDSITDHQILRQLVLDDCRDLVYLPELPPYLQHLSAFNCISLEKDFTQYPVPEHVLQSVLNCREKPEVSNEFVFFFPGARVPDGFRFITGEASITPANIRKSDLCGFIFCIILKESLNVDTLHLVQLIYENEKEVGYDDSQYIGKGLLLADHVLCWYGSIDKLVNIQESEDDDQFYNISFEFKLDDKDAPWSMEGIKGCGVYPVYAWQVGWELSDRYREEKIHGSKSNAQISDTHLKMDIDELQPIVIECSNNDNEDDQEQILTTSSSKEGEDLSEKPSCDCFIGPLLKRLWTILVGS